MTHQERSEIERRVPSTVVLSWRPHEESRFVRLTAKPCPLLDGNQCSVYDVRPFNCRRYGCLRKDVTTEAWVEGPPVPQTRDDRRTLVVLQRHGQRWARSHGWPVE